MRCLREAVRLKRPERWQNNDWMLHVGNARPHTAHVVLQFLAKHSTIQIPHPPYSPDLAPNDFFLYPKLKINFKGRKFDNVDMIQAESKATLRNLSKSDFISCFDNWKKRWNGSNGRLSRHPVLKEDKKQESSKMETNEIRAVIKYLCKKGMSQKEIYEDMVDTLRKDAPSYSTVKKWVAAFKLGRISTEEEYRPGRPVESVIQENIYKMHDLVMLDRRMTVRQIEETFGNPKTTVDRIMREHLGLRKLSARWVPKLLTLDQKAVRRKLSSDNLSLFEANPEEFVNRFVTMNETWAHHFTPESKQQSMQWRHSGSPPPKKAKTVPSAGKVMVSAFWDSEGVLLLDFLNKGQTITGNYYATLVKRLREAIKKKREKRKVVQEDCLPSRQCSESSKLLHKIARENRLNCHHYEFTATLNLLLDSGEDILNVHKEKQIGIQMYMSLTPDQKSIVDIIVDSVKRFHPIDMYNFHIVHGDPSYFKVNIGDPSFHTERPIDVGVTFSLRNS
ncbi:hypothetical protein LAZ67_13001971 [Cordylochernes scorpioides]|uniref:Mos1 transposase HTH domain-containing protein n=1 Tax=Cordylochernes scorpioides TaxID=51811 RepID=A0ABY6L497_9ARAC|nr:hypothetical protein LAZ67_13001971 [Cordylochernes scorpioides]